MDPGSGGGGEEECRTIRVYEAAFTGDVACGSVHK